MIRKGDNVTIKPEFMDGPRDNDFTRVAMEDEDGGRVRIMSIIPGFTINPNTIVEVRMLDVANAQPAEVISVYVEAWNRSEADWQAGKPQWREVTESIFYELLEVVPPLHQDRGMFMVGECWSHEKGQPIHLAVKAEGERSFVRMMPVADFKALQRVAWERGAEPMVLKGRDEVQRVQLVTTHGTLLARGECSIRWYRVGETVWCVRSATQCDFCGPFRAWKPPAHATLVD